MSISPVVWFCKTNSGIYETSHRYSAPNSKALKVWLSISHLRHSAHSGPVVEAFEFGVRSGVKINSNTIPPFVL